jgi:hypothetical protein
MTANKFQVKDREELLALAQRTLAALGTAAASNEGTAPIETNSASLIAIAKVITQMLEDMQACGGAGCMGRAVDGTRLWVTQDRFDVVHAQGIRLRAILQQIAAEDNQDEGYDMLVDWRENTSTLRRLARAALEQS